VELTAQEVLDLAIGLRHDTLVFLTVGNRTIEVPESYVPGLRTEAQNTFEIPIYHACRALFGF
jgi:hypothetical protein